MHNKLSCRGWGNFLHRSPLKSVFPPSSIYFSKVLVHYRIFTQGGNVSLRVSKELRTNTNNTEKRVGKDKGEGGFCQGGGGNKGPTNSEGVLYVDWI